MTGEITWCRRKHNIINLEECNECSDAESCWGYSVGEL